MINEKGQRGWEDGRVREGLSRRAISEAVEALGWRLVLGSIRTAVHVGSLAEAVKVPPRAWEPLAEGRLSADVRENVVVLTLQMPDRVWVGAEEIALAERITAKLRDMGLRPAPEPVQQLEIAIDAVDIAAVRPFWMEVLGYVDEPGAGPAGAIVDPQGLGSAVWFQQTESPRPQRKRLHLDVSVPPDQARQRLHAALAAGGRLVSDRAAPAFWVLADAEGNEVCVSTWEGREDPA